MSQKVKPAANKTNTSMLLIVDPVRVQIILGLPLDRRTHCRAALVIVHVIINVLGLCYS